MPLEVAGSNSEATNSTTVAVTAWGARITTALASDLASRGITQLDVAAVRGPDRTLTRAIATWAYVATDDDGDPKYSGIRYRSRLGDHEGWAVFDGTDLRICNRQPIELTDPDLVALADQFGLRIF